MQVSLKKPTATFSDGNGIRGHDYLVRKPTLVHLAKLEKFIQYSTICDMTRTVTTWTLFFQETRAKIVNLLIVPINVEINAFLVIIPNRLHLYK